MEDRICEMKLTEREEYAIRVRTAVAKAGPAVGYPKTVVDGIRLRIGQCYDTNFHGHPRADGGAWYCPDLYGYELVQLLDSARAKGARI